MAQRRTSEDVLERLSDLYSNRRVCSQAQVIDAWHALPPDTRTAILAIVGPPRGSNRQIRTAVPPLARGVTLVIAGADGGVWPAYGPAPVAGGAAASP